MSSLLSPIVAITGWGVHLTRTADTKATVQGLSRDLGNPITIYNPYIVII